MEGPSLEQALQVAHPQKRLLFLLTQFSLLLSQGGNLTKHIRVHPRVLLQQEPRLGKDERKAHLQKVGAVTHALRKIKVGNVTTFRVALSAFLKEMEQQEQKGFRGGPCSEKGSLVGMYLEVIGALKTPVETVLQIELEQAQHLDFGFQEDVSRLTAFGRGVLGDLLGLVSRLLGETLE